MHIYGGVFIWTIFSDPFAVKDFQLSTWPKIWINLCESWTKKYNSAPGYNVDYEETTEVKMEKI